MKATVFSRSASPAPSGPRRWFARATFLLLAVLGAGVVSVRAQEIPKGLALTAELGQGFSHVRGGDDRYLATWQLSPQWTILPGRLRAGPTLGLFYPGTRVGALAGGRLTWRVVQGPPIFLGSSFHVHLLGEYLPLVWTSPDTWRQWVGVGVGVETSNLLSLSIKFHRDFATPVTYGQLAVAFNLFYKKGLPGHL